MKKGCLNKKRWPRRVKRFQSLPPPHFHSLLGWLKSTFWFQVPPPLLISVTHSQAISIVIHCTQCGRWTTVTGQTFTGTDSYSRLFPITIDLFYRRWYLKLTFSIYSWPGTDRFICHIVYNILTHREDYCWRLCTWLRASKVQCRVNTCRSLESMEL